jgi:hypothetical protein
MKRHSVPASAGVPGGGRLAAKSRSTTRTGSSAPCVQRCRCGLASAGPLPVRDRLAEKFQVGGGECCRISPARHKATKLRKVVLPLPGPPISTSDALAVERFERRQALALARLARRRAGGAAARRPAGSGCRRLPW